jgi:photosystem II stability/assembly factor-like uncharacterized protein
MRLRPSLKRPVQSLLELATLLLLLHGLVLSVQGQQGSPWQVIKQLSPQTQKAFYVDREPGSQEPETISRPPILEAVFFHDSLTGWAAGDSGVIVNTRDGGRTWTAGMISFPVNLKSLFFHNRREGWAAGNAQGAGAILRTEDGGGNWRLQSKIEGFELSGLHDVWFADERHGWAVGEAQQSGVIQGIILATQDGGAHWQPQYLAKERSTVLSAVRFADTRRGWVVGHNVILYTQDGGQQWREQRYAEGEYFFDVDVLNSTDAWVVGSDGKLLSTPDGGRTWQARQLPLKYRNLWLASVKFNSSVRGWVAGDNGAIFSTCDGGQTWFLESNGATEYLRGLASTSDSVFAVGNNGIILRRPM